MKARQLFGTDGIRGKANVAPMNTETALRFGRALAYLVLNNLLALPKKGHRGRIVIGKDTRLSGYMFEQAIAAGICSMGVDVLLVGPLPTPGIAFITHSMRADAGIVVSASHNPFDDNGFKIFGPDGFKLSDKLELLMEELILTDRIDNLRPVKAQIGRASRIDDAIGRYIVFLKNFFPKNLSLDGVRIVLDCAHGAGYRVAPEVFSELGAEVITLGVSPNGENINDGVGSMHPQGVERKVLESRADFGIALDGDADRLVVVDERGKTVDGDAVLALSAKEFHHQGRLKKNSMVCTVMSNLGLDRCLAKEGISVERSQVGDRYVVEKMRQNGFNLGGESSGHIIFLDHSTTGDGTLAAVVLMGELVRTGKSIHELASSYVPFPQEVSSFIVKQKIPLVELEILAARVKKVEADLKGDGRVLIRYSGTEMKARILVEGDNQDRVKQYAMDLKEVMLKEIADKI